jgi:hypothetical protein
MRVLGISTIVLVLSLPLRSSGQEKPAPGILPGGGLASANGDVGYWPSRDKGIEAVDLETGKVLWHSKLASKPLLTTTETLVAQAEVPNKANQVRVVILDLKDGAKKLESQPIVFPDWVSVPTQYGRTFHSMARADKNDVQLVWEARAFYAGGAAPTREILEAARKHAVGVTRIDTTTGKVNHLAGQNLRPMWTEVNTAKFAQRVIKLEEKPANDPNNPLQQRRYVQATNAVGKVLWQHEILAPRALIPPP